MPSREGGRRRSEHRHEKGLHRTSELEIGGGESYRNLPRIFMKVNGNLKRGDARLDGGADLRGALQGRGGERPSPSVIGASERALPPLPPGPAPQLPRPPQSRNAPPEVTRDLGRGGPRTRAMC